MYSIRYDIGEHILHLRLEGFWSPATLACFTAELLVRTTPLRMRGTRYAVLSDATRFAIQSPLVSQGFRHVMDKGGERHHGPTAIVVAGHLNKMQAERTLLDDHVRIFLDEAEARAWLVTEMAQVSA